MSRDIFVMQIGKLAHETGLTSHTLRYYEKEGLLPKRYVQRGLNNYRHYTPKAVERITTIKTLHAAGFTLSDIKDFLSRWETGQLTPKEALSFIQQKLDAIDTRIKKLEMTRDFLVKGLSAHIERAKRRNSSSRPAKRRLHERQA